MTSGESRLRTPREASEEGSHEPPCAMQSTRIDEEPIVECYQVQVETRRPACCGARARLPSPGEDIVWAWCGMGVREELYVVHQRKKCELQCPPATENETCV